MPSSDSDNVVDATPPKQTKLFKKKMKSNTDHSKHSIEDFFIHTSSNQVGDTLEASSAYTKFNKPYIYCSIEEVMKLPKNNILNNNIHTIGLHKFLGNNKHYLTIHWVQNSKIQICLNFKYVQSTPKDNEIVSVYGSINNNIFDVKFYKIEAKAIIDKYIENLKYLRNVIPKEYLINSNYSS